MQLKTLGLREHTMDGQWEVRFHEEFAPEFRGFSLEVREEIAVLIENLRNRGPLLGRPYVDTLKGARHTNMKELRFSADGGVWRVAFAFDPLRQGILLVAGDKAGVSQERFYEGLIRVADQRYSMHLNKLRASQEKR